MLIAKRKSSHPPSLAAGGESYLRSGHQLTGGATAPERELDGESGSSRSDPAQHSGQWMRAQRHRGDRGADTKTDDRRLLQLPGDVRSPLPGRAKTSSRTRPHSLQESEPEHILYSAGLISAFDDSKANGIGL